MVDDNSSHSKAFFVTSVFGDSNGFNKKIKSSMEGWIDESGLLMNQDC